MEHQKKIPAVAYMDRIMGNFCFQEGGFLVNEFDKEGKQTRGQSGESSQDHKTF